MTDSVRVSIPSERTVPAEQLPDLMLDQDEARRLVRLDLRVMLNQRNGTFSLTNRLADELADVVVRTLRQEGAIPRD